MYISLYDLGLLFLFAIVAIAGVYLIMIMHRVLSITGQVQTFFQAHNEDISELLTVLPKTLTHVGELAESLKDMVDDTSNALTPLKNDFVDTVDDLRDGMETILFYAEVIKEVFRTIFSKSK